MREAISRMAGGAPASLVFSPHLVPMTRGILATCYARGRLTTDEALRAAREFYAESAFVRVVDSPPHSKWAQGTNLAFVSYAADPRCRNGHRARRRGQPRQGRGRPGRPEHESDARLP